MRIARARPFGFDSGRRRRHHVQGPGAPRAWLSAPEQIGRGRQSAVVKRPLAGRGPTNRVGVARRGRRRGRAGSCSTARRLLDDGVALQARNSCNDFGAQLGARPRRAGAEASRRRNALGLGAHDLEISAAATRRWKASFSRLEAIEAAGRKSAGRRWSDRGSKRRREIRQPRRRWPARSFSRISSGSTPRP